MPQPFKLREMTPEEREQCDLAVESGQENPRKQRLLKRK
jgi:hypothetical protein